MNHHRSSEHNLGLAFAATMALVAIFAMWVASAKWRFLYLHQDEFRSALDLVQAMPGVQEMTFEGHNGCQGARGVNGYSVEAGSDPATSCLGRPLLSERLAVESSGADPAIYYALASLLDSTVMWKVGSGSADAGWIYVQERDGLAGYFIYGSEGLTTYADGRPPRHIRGPWYWSPVDD